MSPFTVLEHTADIGLRAEGHSLEELFISAAEGLYHLLGLPDLPCEHSHGFSLHGEDYEELLVAWLQELLFLLESGRFRASCFTISSLSDTTLEAEVHGSTLLDQQAAAHEIKAATYHQLKIAFSDDTWQATVYFDL